MRNVYVTKNYAGLHYGGNKARVDVETVIKDRGYRNIGLRTTFYQSRFLGFFVTLAGVLKAICCVRKGDRVFLQYPFKKYYTFLCRMIRFRGGYVITLIHDLACFRGKKLSLEGEIQRLSHSDYLIATNASMKEWMLENGFKAPIGAMGLWDFITDARPQPRPDAEARKRVVYVGFLSQRKQGFIYRWDAQLLAKASYSIDFYGKGLEEEKLIHKDRIRNYGSLPEREIITSCTGDYGLIWYGHVLDPAQDPYGEYMRLNSPHKASLYIRCGMPLIAWEHSALGHMVREHGIGLCIGTLDDLEAVISNVSEQQYRDMKRNVALVCDKIATGYFIDRALRQAGHFLSSSVE